MNQYVWLGQDFDNQIYCLYEYNRIIFYSPRIPIIEGDSIALVVVTEFLAHENLFCTVAIS
jgi:hypothetical protein